MKIELKRCPICKSEQLSVWRVRLLGRRRGPWGYFVECDQCHCCGETRWFVWWAKKVWNRKIGDIVWEPDDV